MAYRYDSDLEFLSECKSKDLDDLVYCLTKDKDGSPRLTEELTLSNGYKHYYPEHNLYWKDIAAEIQCFGANSFATIFRGGKGVLYREVLMDVCDKLKVNFNKNSSVAKIEQELLAKILEQAIERMTAEELKELASSLGIKNTQSFSKKMATATFLKVFQMGGFKSYQLTVMIANAVLKALIGRGLTLGGNAILTRTASILTGPIGWVITGLWTAIDISGPAYRVTIPAVIEVAVLRKKLLDGNIEDIEFN